ncbi:MAG: hypothetical protein AB7R55_18230, partial [Gemmatimonadales bacterium]
MLALALALPGGASAHLDAWPDSARTALFSRHLVPVQTVALRLTGREIVTGRLVERSGDSLRLWEDRRLTVVELNQVVAAWVKKTESKRYGLIGGIVGAVAGSLRWEWRSIDEATPLAR